MNGALMEYYVLVSSCCSELYNTGLSSSWLMKVLCPLAWQSSLCLSPTSRFLQSEYAATFKDIRTTRIGVVIRDCSGMVVATLCRKLAAPLGPIEAKSKALEAGILFALCRGCPTVVLEGDSQVLINALVRSSPCPSTVVSVIEGVLELCKGFSYFQFSHGKRQGNIPAHLVAKNAYSIVNDIVWVEEDPCFAKQALIHDVSFMVS
ncbi:uncharacterized protein LOC112004930 [Quercus suber]|uniref:uncharacterized protein LOC112004930 n=1 Tax=Quercus suber TaxID=58331 RepID=UPI000CE23595|nr:uncharacterized protein LOC112004930 [Quercus suber]POE60263.1 hypothetical protein CFP56_57776 [Quercus suber]